MMMVFTSEWPTQAFMPINLCFIRSISKCDPTRKGIQLTEAKISVIWSIFLELVQILAVHVANLKTAEQLAL